MDNKIEQLRLLEPPRKERGDNNMLKPPFIRVPPYLPVKTMHQTNKRMTY